MRRPLTLRERRGAALILLVAAIWLLYWLLIGSWFAGPLADIDAELETLREQQQRYVGQLSQRDALQEQLEQAQRDPASRDSLLPAGDPSAVAADLMQRIADLIKRESRRGAGCVVTQRMPITPEQDGAEPYRQVKVSLTMDCSIEPLIALMHTLEYERPFLFIESFNIRRGGDSPEKGGAGKLAVHLLIRGYLPPAPTQAPARQNAS
ncbi:type II secretion system protein GspM [Pseudomonas sp. nanlin1]|uniref:type II secretion system protein GspM n=1 Tax=Pseudomonas sp. nanlin1 TaxID=3040605 RepID=UPI00388E6081